jgi:hypothetical protein
MELTRVSFHYAKIADEQTDRRMGYGNFRYKLARIETSAVQMTLNTASIERSTVCGPDLSQLQLFNEVFLSECNSGVLRIVFHDPAPQAYKFSSVARTLVKVADECGAMKDTFVPDQDQDGDTFFASSAQTLVHDYVETNSGRFFHVGISLLPVGPIFMPLWLCEERLKRLVMHDWVKANDVAKKESLLVLRCLDGRNSIRHVVGRGTSEKHA